MKISIISTVYNKENFLETHINSLLNQDYNNIEFIFVNDGSTDDSEKILKKYKKLDSRIKIINQKNMGVSIARKNGFIKSTGEIVYFVDSDDTLYNEKSISRVMNIFKKHPSVDLVISTLCTDYGQKKVYDKIIYNKKIISGEHDVENLYDEDFRFNLVSKLFRKRQVKENDFADIKNFEDGIFTYNVLSKSKRFYYDDYPIYIVNRKISNNNSITTKKNKTFFKEKFKAIELMKKNILSSKSIKKLELRSYLDDLYNSIELDKIEREKLLLNIRNYYDDNIIKIEYLRKTSHYLIIYFMRKIYLSKNAYKAIKIYRNTIIIFKQRLKELVRKIHNEEN